MDLNTLNNYHIILASGSPRRKYLLEKLGVRFEIQVMNTPEDYPDNLSGDQIASYLAKAKAEAFPVTAFKRNTLVIAADTIVWYNNQNLGKPTGYDEAFFMLKSLSGKKHDVITAVCLRSISKIRTFFSKTAVYFKNFSDNEINYYINEYKPYDKAGGYGIQEWIGYIGVEKIEGSYFNVMGLPVQQLYQELKEFKL
jgi:septum formation protein